MVVACIYDACIRVKHHTRHDAGLATETVRSTGKWYRVRSQIGEVAASERQTVGRNDKTAHNKSVRVRVRARKWENDASTEALSILVCALGLVSHSCILVMVSGLGCVLVTITVTNQSFHTHSLLWKSKHRHCVECSTLTLLLRRPLSHSLTYSLTVCHCFSRACLCHLICSSFCPHTHSPPHSQFVIVPQRQCHPQFVVWGPHEEQHQPACLVSGRQQRIWS